MWRNSWVDSLFLSVVIWCLIVVWLMFSCVVVLCSVLVCVSVRKKWVLF